MKRYKIFENKQQRQPMTSKLAMAKFSRTMNNSEDEMVAVPVAISLTEHKPELTTSLLKILPSCK